MFSASEIYCWISLPFPALSDLCLTDSTQLFYLKLSKLTDSIWLLTPRLWLNCSVWPQANPRNLFWSSGFFSFSSLFCFLLWGDNSEWLTFLVSRVICGHEVLYSPNIIYRLLFQYQYTPEIPVGLESQCLRIMGDVMPQCNLLSLWMNNAFHWRPLCCWDCKGERIIIITQYYSPTSSESVCLTSNLSYKPRKSKLLS